ncbi:MAG: polysaccharide deacetylase family protein [Clostridia bacterium]|nr:polysaccharide deacetylase family protein [Clostridia bacterium]
MSCYYTLHFPEGKMKALTFSYDDGVDSDIRLMEIFKKNGLKGTFNLNGGLMNGTAGAYSRRLLEDECKTVYADPDFEVACHAYTHPFLEKCDPAVCLDEIVSDRMKLESLFDCEVHGMAYPFGTYNDTVINCCQSAGIYYNRTVNGTMNFSIPTNWLTWHPTCHHVNEKIFELAEKFLNQPVTPKEPARLFYIWGHSYEFNQRNDWDRMEQLCELLGGHDDVWYATNIEIYRYCRSFSRLKYSADGKTIYNPTADKLWLRDGVNGDVFTIDPGETVNR